MQNLVRVQRPELVALVHTKDHHHRQLALIVVTQNVVHTKNVNLIAQQNVRNVYAHKLNNRNTRDEKKTNKNQKKSASKKMNM